MGPLTRSCAQARGVPGYLASLLRVVTQDGVPPEIAMQAAIQFKNSVADSWVHHDESERVYSDEEKASVREIVVEVCVCVQIACKGRFVWRSVSWLVGRLR